MPKFTTNEIQLDELYLDEKNPRFIVPPSPSQQGTGILASNPLVTLDDV